MVAALEREHQALAGAGVADELERVLDRLRAADVEVDAALADPTWRSASSAIARGELDLGRVQVLARDLRQRVDLALQHVVQARVGIAEVDRRVPHLQIEVRHAARVEQVAALAALEDLRRLRRSGRCRRTSSSGPRRPGGQSRACERFHRRGSGARLGAAALNRLSQARERRRRSRRPRGAAGRRSAQCASRRLARERRDRPGRRRRSRTRRRRSGAAERRGLGARARRERALARRAGAARGARAEIRAASERGPPATRWLALTVGTPRCRARRRIALDRAVEAVADDVQAARRRRAAPPRKQRNAGSIATAARCASSSSRLQSSRATCPAMHSREPMRPCAPARARAPPSRGARSAAGANR